MALPILIAGLILLIAGGSWFTGAVTVGIILTVVGGLATVVPLLIFLAVAAGIISGR